MPLAAGEKVALVGPSGAGKTTLVHLILRFYEPQQGEILIDGVRTTEIPLAELRQRVTIVPQNAYLFTGTIGENIRCGLSDISDDAVEEAARMARAHRFIRRLPGGYEFDVGPRGIKLSGGERQRIAIARALLRNPGILILDEATSEVDTESESLIQQALETLLAGRTAFIVAHRHSGTRIADRVVVLDKGRIVADGRHGDIYQRSEFYRQLCDRQGTVEPLRQSGT